MKVSVSVSAISRMTSTIKTIKKNLSFKIKKYPDIFPIRLRTIFFEFSLMEPKQLNTFLCCQIIPFILF